MSEDITSQTLPDADAPNGTAAAGGEGAGSETATGEEVVEVKDLLKTVLNKDFPTNEAAIKSLQDTYKAVTEQGGTIKTLTQAKEEAESKAVSPDLEAQVQTLQTQVRDANFYAANPDFNTPEAKALIEKFGGNPEEVVNDEVFKNAFGAITKTAEMEQSQSVLHTNPRLGVAQDGMTKASEALKSGDDAGAASAAVGAVLDAYALK